MTLTMRNTSLTFDLLREGERLNDFRNTVVVQVAKKNYLCEIFSFRETKRFPIQCCRLLYFSETLSIPVLFFFRFALLKHFYTYRCYF